MRSRSHILYPMPQMQQVVSSTYFKKIKRYGGDLTSLFSRPWEHVKCFPRHSESFPQIFSVKHTQWQPLDWFWFSVCNITILIFQSFFTWNMWMFAGRRGTGILTVFFYHNCRVHFEILAQFWISFLSSVPVPSKVQQIQNTANNKKKTEAKPWLGRLPAPSQQQKSNIRKVFCLPAVRY